MAESVKLINFNTVRLFVEFDLLVDIDFGLLQFIAANFADDRIFFVNNLLDEENIIKGQLHERKYYNPLVVPAIDEEDSVTLDALYDQFMDQYYEEILQESSVTDILILIKNLALTESGTTVTILCKNYEEAEIVDKIMPPSKKNKNWSVEVYDFNESSYDLVNCDALMIKFSKNVFNYNHLSGKTIYIADLKCNIDPKVWENTGTKYPNMDATLYFEHNQVKFIQMYAYDSSYTDADEFEDFPDDQTEEVVKYNANGTVHYTFEDDPDISHSDVELLKQWLNPEEIEKAAATYVRPKGPVTEIEPLNPYEEAMGLLYDDEE